MNDFKQSNMQQQMQDAHHIPQVNQAIQPNKHPTIKFDDNNIQQHNNHFDLQQNNQIYAQHGNDYALQNNHFNSRYNSHIYLQQNNHILYQHLYGLNQMSSMLNPTQGYYHNYYLNQYDQDFHIQQQIQKSQIGQMHDI
jgi:hypothetical protein